MIYFNFLNLRIKFTFFLGNVLQLNNIKCHFCHINYNRVRMVLEIIKLIKKKQQVLMCTVKLIWMDMANLNVRLAITVTGKRKVFV